MFRSALAGCAVTQRKAVAIATLSPYFKGIRLEAPWDGMQIIPMGAVTTLLRHLPAVHEKYRKLRTKSYALDSVLMPTAYGNK